MRALVAIIAASLAVAAGNAGATETGNRAKGPPQPVGGADQGGAGERVREIGVSRLEALMTLRASSSSLVRPNGDRGGAVAIDVKPVREGDRVSDAAATLGEPWEGPGESIYANPNRRRDPLPEDGVIIAPLPSGVLVGLGGLAGVAVWVGCRRRACVS